MYLCDILYNISHLYLFESFFEDISGRRYRKRVELFVKMTIEAQLETFSQSNSTAFLFKSLKRLYIYAQFIGCACFSYSHGRVHVTRWNFFSLIFFMGIYWTVGYLNLTVEKTTAVTGYQAILFYIGECLFPSHGIFFIWTVVFVFFLARKKIARVLVDIIILDGEVSK